MKIRQANKFDIPRIIEMLKHYRERSPLPCLTESNNEEYAVSLLTHILSGKGAIFLADYEGLTVGMLISVLHPNIWDPNIMALNELAWWVETGHRNTSAGYKLLLEYKNYAENLKKENAIKYYTISKMVNSPDLDYERFGFSKLEEAWRS